MTTRRLLRLSVICLICGCTINVLIAWVCAIYSSPRGVPPGGATTLDPLLMARLRYEFFERAGPDPGGRDPGRLFVSVAYESRGAEFMDIAIEDEDIPCDVMNGPCLRIGVARAGWPLIALEGQWFHDASRSQNKLPERYRWSMPVGGEPLRANRLLLPRMLVFRPLWKGFVFNTLLFAAILIAPYVYRAFVRWRRGQCTACGYPVGQSNVCTECGGRVRPRRADTARLADASIAKLSA